MFIFAQPRDFENSTKRELWKKSFNDCMMSASAIDGAQCEACYGVFPQREADVLSKTQLKQ
jgi:hypothetical protein